MKRTPVWATERIGHEVEELYQEVVDDPTPEQRELIGSEIADIVMFTICVANAYGLDIAEEVHKKLEKNHERFPAHEFQEGDYHTQYNRVKEREGKRKVHDVYNPSISSPENDHFQV